ncbi:hypothetical protein PRZ48_006248 [Zasmidium cellare]|uniref:Uncharacterized protein n=1 Tax=Zasmidium cellare TaxID=395010 RepID=A0ABR0EMX6_ZASCE|nr:hypothetical protein PRZ48_006248 [Zasmidium cellare]
MEKSKGKRGRPRKSEEKGGSNDGLQFILLENPIEAKTTAYRKRVRSHATAHQHRVARERRGKHGSVDHGKSRLGGEADKALADESTESREEAGTVFRRLPHFRAYQTGTSSGISQGDQETTGFAHCLHESAVDDAAQIDADGLVNVDTFEMEPNNSFSRTFSRGIMAFQTFLLQDADNVVGTCLHHLGMDVSSTLGCYEFIVKTQSAMFESEIGPRVGVPERMPHHIRYMRFIFTDPVLITAALLTTVSYLTRSRRHQTGHARDLYHLLQLRGFLFRSINMALSSPSRSLSDQLLVAVALSSAFELEHDPTMQSYKTQMDGLVKMIDLRGGLSRIGDDDPGAERFFMWHVGSTATLSGQHHYYEEVSRTSRLATRPKADASQFRMKNPDEVKGT